jgi:hypothetical protein
MASTKIKELTPELQRLYDKFEAAMALAGLKFKVTCTARTIEEQTALYSQGRNTLSTTNSLRTAAGLSPITDKENKSKVTWTMNSKHLITKDNPKARAFDIVLLKDSKPHWDIKVSVNKNTKPDYREAADIGKSVGLIVGADFKKSDMPHYEI